MTSLGSPTSLDRLLTLTRLLANLPSLFSGDTRVAKRGRLAGKVCRAHGFPVKPVHLELPSTWTRPRKSISPSIRNPLFSFRIGIVPKLVL